MNFLHGIPHFAISIALEREGTIVAGLVYNPATDELFTAERGKGAFLNDQRLRVAARKRLADAVVACALPHPSRGDAELSRSEHNAVQDKVAGLRRFGAAALDLAWVAAGRVRCLLGARPIAVGHGGRHRAGARSRRLRHRSRRARRHDQDRRHPRRQRGNPPRTAADAEGRRKTTSIASPARRETERSALRHGSPRWWWSHAPRSIQRVAASRTGFAQGWRGSESGMGRRGAGRGQPAKGYTGSEFSGRQPWFFLPPRPCLIVRRTGR